MKQENVTLEREEGINSSVPRDGQATVIIRQKYQKKEKKKNSV